MQPHSAAPIILIWKEDKSHEGDCLPSNWLSMTKLPLRMHMIKKIAEVFLSIICIL